MNRKILSLIILVPFTALSVLAVIRFGYIGIFEYELQNAAGWQVLADLVIACLLLLSFLIPHARQHGRNPWPWVAITVVLGSFGPLLYFATSKGAINQPD